MLNMNFNELVALYEELLENDNNIDLIDEVEGLLEQMGY